jgi:hypothetical protein
MGRGILEAFRVQGVRVQEKNKREARIGKSRTAVLIFSPHSAASSLNPDSLNPPKAP